MAAPSFLDAYSVRARIAPVLIAVLPLGLAFAAWLPVADQLKAVPASALTAVAMVTLIAQVGRNAGKKKEADLFRRWGGAPTTHLLSYARSTLPAEVLQRIHERLRAVGPEKQLPLSAGEELRDPAGSDRMYISLTAWLREQTRDQSTFSLVAEENANYGFCRNLWALKPAGVLASILGIGICTVRLASGLLEKPSIDPYVALYCLLSVILLVMWLFRVTPAWVRSAGDLYAERLLASVDRLPVP
jgi:hypothetical protein